MGLVPAISPATVLSNALRRSSVDHGEADHHAAAVPCRIVTPADADPALIADELSARNRAGRAIRDVGHAMIGHQAPVALIEELAATLDRFSERLSDGGPRRRPDESFGTWMGAPADGEPITTFEDRPVSGAASPWGLDITSYRDGEEAVARVTLRSAHEGAPGRSHGGIVAAIFDDVMGFVIQLIEVSAFTGTLSVRYESGVPLHRELVVRTRMANRAGRKIHITAEMWDAATRVATATATFITIPTTTPTPTPTPTATPTATTTTT